MAKTWLDEECAALVKTYQEDARWRDQTLLSARQAGIFSNEKEQQAFRRNAGYLDVLHLLAVIKSSSQFDEVQSNPNVSAKTLVGTLSSGWIASSLGVDTLEIYQERAREAIQPTADLVQRLRDLKAPSLNDDEELGFADRVWYFDFPNQIFPLHEVSVQDKAGVTSTPPTLYVRAVIWHPDQYTLTSIFQIAGQELYIHGYYNEQEDKADFVCSDTFRSKADAANVQRRVFNMVLLLAMYFLTQHEQAKGLQTAAITPIRPVQIDDLDYKRARKKMKGGLSLFSLKQLDAVKGEALPNRPQGHQAAYDYAFEVSGHFRWQPCGIGRAQRKLIWIDPFVKGKDKGEPVKKTRLTELR